MSDDGMRVQIELDDGKFTSGVIRAGQSLEQFERQIGKNITSIKQIDTHSKGFLSTLRDVTVVAGLSGQALGMIHSATTSWASEIIKVNAEFERMNTLMRTLSTSGDPMKESIKSVTAIREMAKNAPFSLDALHQSFTRLNAAGLKPAEGLMQSLVDAVAAFGGGDDVINRASLAFQEMAGKGVVQMKELRNQLGMAIPNAMRLLARSTGESYQDMMSDIHTGTVGAKDAILALQLEFERSFGGAAQDQMQTFNGQLNVMKVALQDIAINHVGLPVNEDGRPNANGFYETTKKQFSDLNGFLQGPAAKGIGDMLGSGLTTSVLAFRSLIDNVIKFRLEIKNAGETLMWTFGFMVGAKAFQAIGGVWEVGVLKMGIFKKELAAVQAAWLAFQELQQARSMIGVGDAQTRAAHGIKEDAYALATTSAWAPDKTPKENASFAKAALPSALGVAGAGIAAVGTGIMAVLPWLPLLAIGLGLVSEHFDVFGHKAKDAYEDLKRFGAATEEDAHKGDAYIKSLGEQAREAEKHRAITVQQHDSYKGSRSLFNVSDRTPAWIAKLAKENQSVDEANKTLDDALAFRTSKIKEGQQNTAKSLSDTDRAPTHDKMKDLIRGYNDASNAAQNLFELNEKMLASQGKSAGAMKLLYQDDQRQRAIELYQAEIALQDQQIANAEKLASAPGISNSDKLRHQTTIDAAQKERNELKRQMEQEKERPMGLQMGKKVQDDAKIITKAKEAFEKAQGDVEAYGAAIRGADLESERLYEVWTKMKAGDAGFLPVKQLVEDMRLARAEADALDKILRGQQSLDRDMDSDALKASNDLFEAQHQGMNELDKRQMKISSGAYAGYGGESPMQKQLSALRQAQMKIGEEAHVTGAALLEMVGAGLVEKTQTVTDKLGGISLKLKEIQGLSTVNLDLKQSGSFDQIGGKIGSVHQGGADEDKVAAQLFAYFTKAGLSQNAAAGLIGNFHQESGLDSSKTNSTGHYGFAQWDQERQGKLREYAASQGKDASDPLTQAAFAMKELTEKFPQLMSQLRMVRDPEQAAIVIRKMYEKPGEFEANDPNRIAYANKTLAANTLQSDYKPRPGTADSILPISTELSLDQQRKADQSRKDDQQARIQGALNDIKEAREKLNAGVEAKQLAGVDGESEFGKTVASIKSMQKDSLGSKNGSHDPDADIYKDLIKSAKEYDRVTTEIDKKKKERTSADNGVKTTNDMLEAEKLGLANETARAKKQPAFSDDVERKREELQKIHEEMVKSYGATATETVAQQKAMSAAIDVAQQRDLEKYLEALHKKTQADEKAVMTKSQQIEEELRKENEKGQKMLTQANATEAQKAQFAIESAKNVAAERAKYLADTPVGKQMKEWGDVSENLQKGVTSWMSSSVDALTTLATTGKANWHQLSQSIMKDLMSTSIKGVFSMLAGGSGGFLSQLFGGGAGKAAGAAAGGGASKLGSLGKLFGGGGLFGIAHTGGIIGSSMLSTRSASMSDFYGAPRFHTGGIIGVDEVPIIAKKGEGVFTQEQMAAIGQRSSEGRSGSATIHNNLTVNASGGTQEQNDDLASKIQDKMEATTRTLVVSELMKQMRPGNLLNNNIH